MLNKLNDANQKFAAHSNSDIYKSNDDGPATFRLLDDVTSSDGDSHCKNCRSSTTVTPKSSDKETSTMTGVGRSCSSRLSQRASDVSRKNKDGRVSPAVGTTRRKSKEMTGQYLFAFFTQIFNAR